jgi:hypothetical protein
MRSSSLHSLALVHSRHFAPGELTPDPGLILIPRTQFLSAPPHTTPSLPHTMFAWIRQCLRNTIVVACRGRELHPP